LALSLILLANLSLSAQEKGSVTGGFGGTIRITGKFSASFKTQTEPPNLAQPFTVMGRIEGNIIHRVWVDKAESSYFGYDLEIEPLSETKQFRVSIKPLSRKFAQELENGGALKALSGRSTATMVNTSFLLSQIVDDGDTVALDVLVNHQTGVKLIDLVTISSSGKPVENPSPGPARDFSLSDVQLTMRNPQLFINSELVTSSSTMSVSGELIYFFLLGRGRFVFSIRPFEGYNFQKLGEIQNNKLSFSLGSDNFELISSTPVIGEGGAWNLWVLHQPDYDPAFFRSKGTFFMGAMGEKALGRED
jgi:hypothetical protein